ELDGIVPISSSWDEHRALLAERKPFRDFEYSRPAADGTIRYVATSGAPIFDEQGKFRGYQGVGRDITDRKRTAEALSLSEERYALAMEASEEGHFDWNVQTDEIFASEHTKLLLGLPADMEFSTRTAMSAHVRYYPGELDRLTQIHRDIL